jgi:TrpR-related protein YerC/YecD
MTSGADIWATAPARQLVDVLVDITDAPTMRAFLRDVLTAGEIEETAARLDAARLLNDGVTYRRVAETTGLSSRTIARISDWMQRGDGGYAAAFSTLSSHHQHV